MGLEETTEVVDFLNRDDNSRIMMGKSDVEVIIHEGEKVQRRVMTHYIYSLHDKFLLEHPTWTLAESTFYKIRQTYCKNIHTVSYLHAKSCMCIWHQNAALLVKSLKSV